MPRDIEGELRRTLQARAGDVTPDPALYARVQARIRRGRTFRLAFAGLATAMVVAGVAVAAPRMMDRVIEFEPGPPGGVATQPAPDATEPAPAVTIGDSRLVFAGGAGVKAMTLDGQPAEGGMHWGCPAVVGGGAGCSEVHSVAAFVDGTEITSVAEMCSLRYSRFKGNVSGLSVGKNTCATSVTISPDGKHLAWIADPIGDGEPMLHTVDWLGTTGADEASFGLPWADASEVSIQDWVWTETGPDTATGYLVLRARREGVIQMVRMPIERQPDGAIAVTWEAPPVEARPGFAPVAFAASGSSVTHTLEVLQEPDGLTGASVVRRINGTIDAEIPVPDELFDSPNFNESDLWMSDNGLALVFGNAGSERAWYVEYGEGSDSPVPLSARIVHGDLVLVGLGTSSEPPIGPGETDGEGTAAQTEVDVYFGMTGADACVADQPVTREVEGAGVARAALTELLEGPNSRESNEGITSPFTANTAGTLNDIAIVDGQARVDFDDFSADVGTDSCTKSAILDSLDKTLLQFPTVKSTQYSFDGDVDAFETWLGSDTEHAAPPEGVTNLALAIRSSAEDRDWEQLRLLSKGTSCTLSDQPEPCVPYWKDQEERGEDPLGTLAELLEGPAAKMPDSPMWVWPAEWAAGEGYNGPRVGIEEGPSLGTAGAWRYYVQEGG